MNTRTIRIAAKLFLSVFLLTCILGSSSGAVRAPGDDPKTKDSGANELSDNPGDKTLVEGQGSSEENRDSGTKETEQSDKIEISSDQPTIGSFTIQIAAFNDEANAGTYIANNMQLLKGYDIFYKSNGELFKVMIGHFRSLEEASYQLREVYNLGYGDTFITALSR